MIGVKAVKGFGFKVSEMSGGKEELVAVPSGTRRFCGFTRAGLFTAGR